MSLVDLNPAGLNLASLKPTTAASLAQDEAAQVQADTARVQLTNAQDEQQRNQAFRAQQKIAAQAPTVEAYTKLLAVAPREYVEGLKASIAQMDASQRKTLASQVLEPWLAGANGRPDLQKEKLEAQAAGFEARGMTEKAAGARDLIAKIDTDPDGVTAKLYATYVEAVGHEKAKAVLDSLGMTEKRLKDRADRILAQAKADPKRTDAELREQLAKAKKAELDAEAAKDAPALAAAQRKTAEIEASLKKQDMLATIDSKEASAYRDVNAGDVSALNAKQKNLTLDADVQKAIDEGRKEKALATVAEAGATKEALEAKREQEAAQTKNFKAQAAKAEADAKALPAHVQDSVLAGSRAARESQAAAMRARTVADGYRRIAASGTGEKGTLGKLQAWAREVAGTENKRDELNQLASRVLNNEIINEAQKIRPVSNEDTAMLRRGLPDPRGNPALVRDFMDALARVQEKQASVQIDETAWQATFKGPNNADKDTNINGVNVKAGESYDGFLRRAGHVRDALNYARNPATPPEKRAEALARLKAAGENVDGR